MVIKEFLPNPFGKDTEGEYILLFNESENYITLSGWSLADASGKRFLIPHTSLSPLEEISFSYSQTKIALNNSGETISLYNDVGELVHELSFTGSAREGERIFQYEDTTLLRDAYEELWEPYADEFSEDAFSVSANALFLPGLVIGLIFAIFAVWMFRKLPQ